MPAQKKDASVRRRRNTAPTATTLRVVAPGEERPVPELQPEERENSVGDPIGWLPITRRWWQDLWTSPMASEYTSADYWQLLVLADLQDRFWRSPSKDLAGEIRLQRQAFGLTPYDRRRLEWTIEEAEDKKAAGARRRSTAAPAVPVPEGEDPRAIMGAV